MKAQVNKQEGEREEFPDGSMLILEIALAKEVVFREGRPVNYNDPLPRRLQNDRK